MNRILLNPKNISSVVRNDDRLDSIIQCEGVEWIPWFIEHCTRPITIDDVREMIRMPEEWTETQRKEYEGTLYEKDGYNVWQVGDPEDAARKAIDIALRPAPEPDPWEEMDKLLKENAERQRANYPFTLDMVSMLVTWNRLKATRKVDE